MGSDQEDMGIGLARKVFDAILQHDISSNDMMRIGIEAGIHLMEVIGKLPGDFRNGGDRNNLDGRYDQDFFLRFFFVFS
jgi:hypothetical protein